MLMAAFYNVNFKKQSGAKYTVEDFGVKLPAEREQTAEEYWRSKYKQDETEKRAILGQAFGGAKPDAP